MVKDTEIMDVKDMAKSAKAIITLAKDIAAKANHQGRRLHVVLVSAVSHAVEHGDTRIIDQVFATVSQAMARGKIVVWLTGLSNLKNSKDKNDNVIFRKPADAALTVKLDRMMSVSPWDYSEDPQENEFDFEKKLAGLLMTASKRIKAGKPIARGAEALSPKLAAIAEFVKGQGVNVTLN